MATWLRLLRALHLARGRWSGPGISPGRLVAGIAWHSQGPEINFTGGAFGERAANIARLSTSTPACRRGIAHHRPESSMHRHDGRRVAAWHQRVEFSGRVSHA